MDCDKFMMGQRSPFDGMKRQGCIIEPFFPFLHKRRDLPRFWWDVRSASNPNGQVAIGSSTLIINLSQNKMVNLSNMKCRNLVIFLNKCFHIFNRLLVIRDLKMLAQAFATNGQPRFKNEARFPQGKGIAFNGI